MRLNRITVLSLFIGVCLGAAIDLPRAAGADDDLARQLLLQALDNQYRGHYQATLELVDESFPATRDSLSGQVEFSDEIGERKICLAGPKKAFEYHSLHFGKEQWVTDDNSHRIRRIANRQWKKGMFGTLLTYEDMLKLPTDFFLEYSSCKGVKATDSTYQITMVLKPLFQSFYSHLEVTLGRNPVLLKSMTFYGPQDQKLKTMDIKGYEKTEGKWLISDLTVSDCDSLSRLQMCFRHFSFSPTPVAQMSKAAPGFSLMSKRVPDSAGGAKASDPDGSDEESMEEISN